MSYSSVYTELDAVNLMLVTIGENPVSTLVDGTHEDASIGKFILNTTSRIVQAEGWFFNTEYNYEFEADINGYITIPDTILTVDLKPFNSLSHHVVLRGTRLYDRLNHTYKFPKETKLIAKVVFLLPFEELPEIAKQYIAIKACNKFQASVVGSDILKRFTTEDEYKARAELMRAQSEDTSSNFLDKEIESTFGYSSINKIINRRL